MDSEAELERIRRFSSAARRRIRRLDVLLDEQVRILELDPSFKSRFVNKRAAGYLITKIELRVLTVTFGLAALGAFLAGFWTSRFH